MDSNGKICGSFKSTVPILIIAFIVCFILASCSENTETETLSYEKMIFDRSYVHTIDLKIEDWESFLESALEEKYVPCEITIDDEVFSNVGIRTKGNNSLKLPYEYGLDRFALKIEFDHYEELYYHGLISSAYTRLFRTTVI